MSVQDHGLEAIRKSAVQYPNGSNSEYALRSQTFSEDLAIRIDETSNTVTYFGYAAVGSANSSAVWKIKRMTVSLKITTVVYADGDTNFDNIWDNRASLSYS